MQCLWILVTLLGCLASGLADPAVYDKEYIEREKDLLLVLKYVHQTAWNGDLYAFAKQYDITEDYDSYENVEEVKEFVNYFKRGGFTGPKTAFSLYNPNHLTQTKLLFRVFYSAKSYETLAKVVAWARFHINEKMFLYVVGLTVAHRPNAVTLIMPPPYEVCPYQFVNSEVIKAAQRMKMQGFLGVEKVNGLREVFIPMNYTGWYLHMNPDQKVTYLTEDPTYNAVYYNYNLNYPHWMEGKPYGLDKDRRGELFITVHQQLLSRYYLERLSNDLGHIPEFNWREPIKSGYYPALMFVNGKQIPARQNNHNLYDDNHLYVQQAEDRERRIRDVVDQGYINYGGKVVSLSKPEDINTLGNLLQGNPDAFDLHHNFHDHIVPSYLENYATAVRDPLFYQFYKRLLHNYWRFMSHIKPYTYEEIAFPGVEITSVTVDKVETYFEHFDIDITNAIEVEPDTMSKDKQINEVTFKPDEYFVKARTSRLNHKLWSFVLNVKSEKAVTAGVRVFIGPKYDEYGVQVNFNENRKNFFGVDLFLQELKVGDNVIHRKSTDIVWYGSHQTSYYELYKRVMLAKKGEKEWDYELSKGRCAISRHLIMPKGKTGGMTYQFYFIISPYQPATVPMGSTFDVNASCGVGSGSRFFEDRALLFPLDREIDPVHFYTPNMKFQDVEIFFTGGEDNSVLHF